MARLLQASCLLSLLLAGFLPQSRGQDKSKVEMAPAGTRSSRSRRNVDLRSWACLQHPPKVTGCGILDSCKAGSLHQCQEESLQLPGNGLAEEAQPRPAQQACFMTEMDCHGGVSGTIYEYGALTIDGEEYIPFKQYIGKYVLFVNVASY
uniref:Uncharacterized protein n=2 Tax=Macaca TaxID=9539 RepID=A0A7N9D3T7_MACFA